MWLFTICLKSVNLYFTPSIDYHNDLLSETALTVIWHDRGERYHVVCTEYSPSLVIFCLLCKKFSSFMLIQNKDSVWIRSISQPPHSWNCHDPTILLTECISQYGRCLNSSGEDRINNDIALCVAKKGVSYIFVPVFTSKRHILYYFSFNIAFSVEMIHT